MYQHNNGKTKYHPSPFEILGQFLKLWQKASDELLALAHISKHMNSDKLESCWDVL